MFIVAPKELTSIFGAKQQKRMESKHQ